MVISKIAQEIFRYASSPAGRRVATGIVNSEKLALNYAWKGFKHKSSIVGGIRTGLGGGALAGGLINKSADVPNVALPPFYGPSASKQDQTRNRRKRVRRRYSNRCRPTRRRRRQSRNY